MSFALLRKIVYQQFASYRSRMWSLRSTAEITNEMSNDKAAKLVPSPMYAPARVSSSPLPLSGAELPRQRVAFLLARIGVDRVRLRIMDKISLSTALHQTRQGATGRKFNRFTHQRTPASDPPELVSSERPGPDPRPTIIHTDQ